MAMSSRSVGLKLTFPLFAVVCLMLALVYGPEKIAKLGEEQASATAVIEPELMRPALMPVRSELKKEGLRDAIAGMPSPALRPGFTRPQSLPRRIPKRRPRRVRRSSGAGIDGIFSVGKVKRIDPSLRFTVRGEIFDLRNLRPVINAKVTFQDPETGRYRVIRTNSSGIYHASLRVNIDGYFVTIQRAGYSPRYMRDWIPSLRTQNARRRTDAARQHLKRKFEQTLIFSRAGDLLIRDFALIRRRSGR